MDSLIENLSLTAEECLAQMKQGLDLMVSSLLGVQQLQKCFPADNLHCHLQSEKIYDVSDWVDINRGRGVMGMKVMEVGWGHDKGLLGEEIVFTCTTSS